MSGESDNQNPQPQPTPPPARRLAEKGDATSPKPRQKRKTDALAAHPEPRKDVTPEPPEALAPHLKAPLEAHQYKMGLVGGVSVSGKSEADIKAWADRKALEMLPAALAELNFNLKFGTDKQRSEAVDRVIDMHGLRKREAQAGQHATIILNLGGGKDALAAKLPWLKREDNEE